MRKHANYREKSVFIFFTINEKLFWNKKRLFKEKVLIDGLVATYPFLYSNVFYEGMVFLESNIYDNSMIFVDRFNK